MVRTLVIAGLLFGTVACGGDVAPATSGDDAAVEVQPGHATLVAGDLDLDLIVFECRVGEETGSPNRRLALSASTTEPFLDSDVVVNVDILVSQVTGEEEHRITVTRFDGEPDLAAGDGPRPGAGPAPDDWIDVDLDARRVTGAGFELLAADGTGLRPAGRFVSDCPVVDDP